MGPDFIKLVEIESYSPVINDKTDSGIWDKASVFYLLLSVFVEIDLFESIVYCFKAKVGPMGLMDEYGCPTVLQHYEKISFGVKL